MKTKELVIITVAVTAVIAVTSIAAYANQYGMYNQGGYPGYGTIGGMMQGQPNQYYQDYQGQAPQGGYGWGGMGMMGGGSGGMMGGMMGGGGGNDQNGYGSCPMMNGAFNNDAGTVVVIAGYSFNPQTLKVPVGTTVTWINMDGVAHSVESGTHEAPTGLFESELLGHMQSFSYTFNEPGTYTYHCDPHPEMTGTIVVEG